MTIKQTAVKPNPPPLPHTSVSKILNNFDDENAIMESTTIFFLHLLQLDDVCLFEPPDTTVAYRVVQCHMVQNYSAAVVPKKNNKKKR